MKTGLLLALSVMLIIALVIFACIVTDRQNDVIVKTLDAGDDYVGVVIHGTTDMTNEDAILNKLEEILNDDAWLQWRYTLHVDEQGRVVGAHVFGVRMTSDNNSIRW